MNLMKRLYLLGKVISVEWRLLCSERNLILILPLILLVEFVFAFGVRGPYGAHLNLNAALLAQQNTSLLSIILVGVAIFFTTEALARDRDLRFRDIILSTPIPTSFFLLGKWFAVLGLIMLVIVLSLALSLCLQLIVFQTPLELKPHLVLYLLVLFPTTIYAAGLALALNAICRNKYLAVTMCLLYLGSVAYLFFIGERHWLINFPAFLLYTYSDLIGFGPYRPGIVWSRLFYLDMTLGLLILAGLFFDRTQQAFRSYFSSLYWRRQWKLIVGLIFTLSLAGVLATTISTEMERGWDSQRWERFWRDYSRTNGEAYREAPNITVTHYQLRLDLYPSDHRFHIEAAFLGENYTGRDLDRVLITLNPDFVLKRLGIAGRRIQVVDRRGLLVVKLHPPIEPGGTVNILMTYEGNVPPGLNRQSASLYSVIAEGGTFLASPLQQGFVWLPSFGYFGLHENEWTQPVQRRARPGEALFHRYEINPAIGLPPPFTLHLTVSVPAGETAISCGELQAVKTQAGRTIYVWEMNRPTYYFPVLSGRFLRASRGPCEVWYYPTHGRNVEIMLDIAEAILDFYSRIYTPYPLTRLRIVEFPRVGRFAQTYPGVTALSEDMGFAFSMSNEGLNPLYWLLAHEIAHQWWGSSVRPATVGSGLLSEGLANFSALLAIEHILGKAKQRLLLQQMEDRYLRWRPRGSEWPLIRSRVRRVRDLTLIYDKGAYVFFMLMHQMRREAFLSALRTYFRRYQLATQMPTLEDLLTIFREQAPGLKWFYDQWFYQVIMPDYRIDHARVRSTAQGYTVEFDIENSGTGRMPVTIEISAKNQKTKARREVIWIGSHRHVRDSITVDFEPARLTIDPDHEVLDFNRRNNSIALHPSS